MSVLLHQRSDAHPEHQQDDDNSAAADDQRQKYCTRRTPNVGLMGSTDSDAVNNQPPNQSNQATAAWNNAEKCGCTVSVTKSPEACLIRLVRAAQHHQANMNQGRPDE